MVSKKELQTNYLEFYSTKHLPHIAFWKAKNIFFISFSIEIYVKSIPGLHLSTLLQSDHLVSFCVPSYPNFPFPH